MHVFKKTKKLMFIIFSYICMYMLIEILINLSKTIMLLYLFLAFSPITFVNFYIIFVCIYVKLILNGKYNKIFQKLICILYAFKILY